MSEETRPRTVKACEVTPGLALRNPGGGGSRGPFIAASAPRQAGDGVVEIEAEEGRTGRFRAGTDLYLNWAAMDQPQHENEREAE